MQQLVAGRRARLLVALLGLLVLVVGLTLTSQARAQAPICNVSELSTQSGSDAGGTLVKVTTQCTGHAQEVLTVAVTRGDATVFKAVLDKTVSGNLSETDAIHLPLLLEDEICASINDQKVCTPTL